MGALFYDEPDGHRSELTPLAKLTAYLDAARTYKDAGRVLHEIKQVLFQYPELERCVPDHIKKPPCLAVNNDRQSA